MMELNTFVIGDALPVLQMLSDNFVDVTVASPPYNMGDGDAGDSRESAHPLDRLLR